VNKKQAEKRMNLEEIEEEDEDPRYAHRVTSMISIDRDASVTTSSNTDVRVPEEDEEDNRSSSLDSASTDGPQFVSYGRRPSNVKILSMDSLGSWKVMSCKTPGMRSPSPSFSRVRE
jgi:anti-sigma factor ChrR (cupin superfamily)